MENMKILIEKLAELKAIAIMQNRKKDKPVIKNWKQLQQSLTEPYQEGTVVKSWKQLTQSLK